MYEKMITKQNYNCFHTRNRFSARNGFANFKLAQLIPINNSRLCGFQPSQIFEFQFKHTRVPRDETRIRGSFRLISR